MKESQVLIKCFASVLLLWQGTLENSQLISCHSQGACHTPRTVLVPPCISRLWVTEAQKFWTNNPFNLKSLTEIVLPASWLYAQLRSPKVNITSLACSVNLTPESTG